MSSNRRPRVKKPKQTTFTKTQFGVPAFRSIFNGIMPLGRGGSPAEREHDMAVMDAQVGREQWRAPPIVSGQTRDGRRGEVPQSVLV